MRTSLIAEGYTRGAVSSDNSCLGRHGALRCVLYVWMCVCRRTSSLRLDPRVMYLIPDLLVLRWWRIRRDTSFLTDSVRIR